MPLTSASSQNVNVQHEAVSEAVAYFNQQKQKVGPLATRLSQQQGQLEIAVTGLSGVSRKTAESLIESIQTTRDRTLKDVEQNIDLYLSEATRGLEQITDIQNQLSKGRVFRRDQKGGSMLVDEAQKICASILDSQRTAKNNRAAIARGAVENGLGAIGDSIRMFDGSLDRLGI